MIGGIRLVVNGPVTLELFGRLGDSVTATRLGFAAVLVAALSAGQRRGSNALVLPVIILSALLLSNGGAVALGASAESRRADGRLI